MGDEMNLDQYDVTPEWVTETEEENLLPTGKFEGMITGYTTRVVDKTDSPFQGYPMIRVAAELYNVEGRTRPHFFDVSPVKILGSDGRQRSESRLMSKMAKITGESNAPKILTAIQMVRCRFKISKSEAKDGYGARNWTDDITRA